MALNPFLTLHMKYLGIAVADIGILFAVVPITTLITTPVIGLLADKVGNFKIMLSVLLTICAALAQLPLFVPSVKNIRIEDSSWTNDAVFRCQPSLGEHNAQLTFNESLPLKDCLGFCESGNLKPMLCFRNDIKERCGVSDVTFDVDYTDGGVKISNSNKTINIVYNNLTFSSVTCKMPLADSLCMVKCKTLRNRTEQFIIDPKSKTITFWAYLVIRMTSLVVIAAQMGLLKAAVLTVLDKHGADYGFQRLWVKLAVCVVPPIIGAIMDQLKDGDVHDYRPCFYIYGALKLLTAVVVLILDLSVKMPSAHVWKNLGQLLKKREVDVLLFYCMLIGSCWGYFETFFLWFMEDNLGASKYIMGLTFTVGSSSSIPITLVAGFLIRKFGHVKLIVFGLFVYCGRFFGCSYVTSAYEALAFESLECITMELMNITITTYSNILSGNELVATMQAAWATLHYSVGKALGSMIGGFLTENLGFRKTFRVYAVVAAIVGMSYLLVYFIFFRKKIHIPEISSRNTINTETVIYSDSDEPAVRKVVSPNASESTEDLCVRPVYSKKYMKGPLIDKGNSGVDNLGCEATRL